MRRICKYCGDTFDGEGMCCKACAEKVKKSVLRERTCRQCGKVFTGGPRAWYCPECRQERKKEADRRAKANRHPRMIGSVGTCEICGNTYTVMSPRQRYCKDCSADAIRAKDREQGKAYYHANKDVDGRRAERQGLRAQIKCAVCGKLFIPSSPAKTCSPECSAELHRRASASWEKANKEHRKEYRKAHK